jgi:hypothetical protein
MAAQCEFGCIASPGLAGGWALLFVRTLLRPRPMPFGRTTIPLARAARQHEATSGRQT